MNVFNRIPIVFSILLFCSLPCAAREWTDVKGRKLEADFVRLDGDEVVLRKDGKELRVELAKFSQEDQDYVKEQSSQPGQQNDAAKDDPEKPWFDKPETVPNLKRPRKWTDRDGKSANAVFTYCIGGKVSLRSGTQTKQIPYTFLSDADQQAIRYYMESEGKGHQVPPGADDITKQFARSWTDREGKDFRAIVRRVERDGRVVMQLEGITAKFPLSGFSAKSQEELRDILADHPKMAARLPQDPDVRTWTDWKGEQFTAKIEPTSRRSFSSFISFKAGKNRISKRFEELCEEDRKYIRKLAEETNARNHLPKPFAEPTTDIRSWSYGSSSKMEGKFVRLDGSMVVLRTAHSAEQKYNLSSLSKADREYVSEIYKSQGKGHLVPLVREDCRKWVIGPEGLGTPLEGKLVAVKDGLVTIMLPDRFLSSGTPKQETYQFPAACLQAADQTYLRDNLPAGTPSDALTKTVSTSTIGAERDWKKRDGKVVDDKPLVYVKSDSIAVGDKKNYRWITFRDLSPADQDHVRREVASMGASHFTAPPPPPPRVSSSGSSNPFPTGPRSGMPRIPGGSSPPSVPTMVMKYKCSKCNRQVFNPKVGDRCPHCGVRWGSKGGGNAAYAIGYTVGTILLVGIVVGAAIGVFKMFNAN